MIDSASELVLDGNAAAGLLQEMFTSDMTVAETQCNTCGTKAGIGSLSLYAASMGAILRCNCCHSALMRLTHTPHGHWLDMSGARYVRF